MLKQPTTNKKIEPIILEPEKNQPTKKNRFPKVRCQMMIATSSNPLALLTAQCNKLVSNKSPPLADAAIGKGFNPWRLRQLNDNSSSPPGLMQLNLANHSSSPNAMINHSSSPITTQQMNNYSNSSDVSQQARSTNLPSGVSLNASHNSSILSSRLTPLESSANRSPTALTSISNSASNYNHMTTVAAIENTNSFYNNNAALVATNALAQQVMQLSPPHSNSSNNSVHNSQNSDVDLYPNTSNAASAAAVALNATTAGRMEYENGANWYTPGNNGQLNQQQQLLDKQNQQYNQFNQYTHTHQTAYAHQATANQNEFNKDSNQWLQWEMHSNWLNHHHSTINNGEHYYAQHQTNPINADYSSLHFLQPHHAASNGASAATQFNSSQLAAAAAQNYPHHHSISDPTNQSASTHSSAFNRTTASMSVAISPPSRFKTTSSSFATTLNNSTNSNLNYPTAGASAGLPFTGPNALNLLSGTSPATNGVSIKTDYSPSAPSTPPVPGSGSGSGSTGKASSRKYNGRGTCDCPNCIKALRNGTMSNSQNKKIEHSCHVPGCGKVYNKTSHLKAHLRWHSGERPFE